MDMIELFKRDTYAVCGVSVVNISLAEAKALKKEDPLWLRVVRRTPPGWDWRIEHALDGIFYGFIGEALVGVDYYRAVVIV